MLSDPHGRHFSYLRLSVIDACNFRCVYCLPDGYRRQDSDEPLSLAELRRAASAFASLGFWKIRLTGGEPTVRHDIVDICAAIRATPGVRRVALSTNGYRLTTLAAPLRAAGLDAVNVSVDSLDRERFHAMTGRDALPAVLSGIEAALDAGIPQVKVNAVLTKRLDDSDIAAFLDYVRERPVAVRFIELMRTGGNGSLFEATHVTSDRLQALLVSRGWKRQPREHGAGPAVEFRHGEYAGRIGLIAPYAPGFCGDCNRLRVTSRGKLHLCLFGETGYPLRELLQNDEQRPALTAEVQRLLGLKTEGHRLHAGIVGANRSFASLGG